ncbi:MAG: MlaD family protein [Gammaproteobacteria bacterium]|nr:MlaD family protein [Gammaproteobacteria bacterium]
MTDAEKNLSNTEDFESLASVPELHPRRLMLSIWLLPLLALLISGWLFYKHLVDKGPVVFIEFESADGIVEDKTKVIYKGLEIGTVDKITLHDDLQGVTVQVGFDLGSEQLLKTNTMFWLVKPRVSLSGVSGLDTIMSGHYIAIRPGDGASQRQFKALNQPPIVDTSSKGLHIRLKTRQLGSISVGSQVLYRQVPVGEIQGYQFSEDESSIFIDVMIEEEFAHLVKKNSRFWNNSGFHMEANLSGIKLKSDSLVSILAGGVSFDHLAVKDSLASQNGDVFHLYNSFDDAEMGIPASIFFNDGFGIKPGTPILVDGVNVGAVKSVHSGNGYAGLVADAIFDPTAQTLLNTETHFWLVKPVLSMNSLNQLFSVMSGHYIAVEPGQSDELEDYFIALDEAPVRYDSSTGLHLQLTADNLGSVQQGMSVYYRQIPVGEVLSYQLADDNKTIIIDIVIRKKFAHLVNRSSRFWSMSGIDLSASLTRLKLQTQSLSSIVMGGIAFTTDRLQDNPIQSGGRFELFENQQASQQGKPKPSTAKTISDLQIVLETEQLGSLDSDAPIHYRQIPVGRVNHYELDQAGDKILVHVTIDGQYRHLVKSNSRFWNASGIEIKGDLSGLSVKTQSLATILEGGIAFLNTNESSEHHQFVREGQHFALYESMQAAQGDIFPITLWLESADGLSENTEIRHKGIKIGQITRLTLANKGHRIKAQAYLDKSAANLARNGTVFWTVRANLGLLKTEHLETLVSGAYIALKPGNGTSKHEFYVSDSQPLSADSDNALHLVLHSNSLGPVKPGNPVFYRQIPVGRVIDARLGQHADSVVIHIIVESPYRNLVSKNSRFWAVNAINAEFGLLSGLNIDIAPLASLLNGGIAFATPDDDAAGQAVADLSEFQLHGEIDREWLDWAPRIELEPNSSARF